MKKCVLIMLIASLFFCLNVVKSSNNEESKSLVGKFTWAEWKQKCDWDLIPTYEYYHPDSVLINELNDILSRIDKSQLKFVVFATTSCEECKEYIPRLFKIFEVLNIADDNIQLYGLDKSLEEPTNTYKKYDIPTTPVVFIHYKEELITDLSYPFLWLEGLKEVFESLE